MSKLESVLLTRRKCCEKAFENLIINFFEDTMEGIIALSLMEYNNNNKVANKTSWGDRAQEPQQQERQEKQE